MRAVAGSAELVGPAISVNSAASTVSFRNRWDLESGFDGGVLEISVNGGAYQDILAAGGTFLENGYNGTINPDTEQPDRRASELDRYVERFCHHDSSASFIDQRTERAAQMAARN